MSKKGGIPKSMRARDRNPNRNKKHTLAEARSAAGWDTGKAKSKQRSRNASERVSSTSTSNAPDRTTHSPKSSEQGRRSSTVSVQRTPKGQIVRTIDSGDRKVWEVTLTPEDLKRIEQRQEEQRRQERLWDLELGIEPEPEPKRIEGTKVASRSSRKSKPPVRTPELYPPTLSKPVSNEPSIPPAVREHQDRERVTPRPRRSAASQVTPSPPLAKTREHVCCRGCGRPPIPGTEYCYSCQCK